MSRTIACDPGTMFFQVAEMEGGNVKVRNTRNAFVELQKTDDIEEVLKSNSWQYVKDGENYYVIGDDCIKVANIFPGKVEVRRPMADGVLNKNEDKKLVVLAEIVKASIGQAPDDKSWVCTCVSSESVDGSLDSTFHKNRLTALFTRLGWKVKIIEEAHAVVLAERPTIVEEDGTITPYSGIGISFGAGRVNCLLAYKGLPVLGMSVARCFSEDFPVITLEGIKPIKDVTTSDFVVSQSGDYTPVVDKINNGKREKLIRLTLENSPFNYDLTHNHKVWVKFGADWDWIEAKDIVPGMQVCEPTSSKTSARNSMYYGYDAENKRGEKVEFSRNFGRFVGAFLGDGSTNIYRDKTAGYVQIAIGSNDEDIIVKYSNILGTLFDRDIQIEQDSSFVRIKLHHTKIAKKLKEDFYRNGDKICNILVTEIPDQMAIGIIEGLLDTDGNKNNREGFDLNTTSSHIALLMHRLLLRFGIKHSWTIRDPRIGGINSKGVQIVGKKDTHVLRISGFAYSMLDLFIKEENRGFCFQKPSFVEYNVKSVEEINYGKDVYDITIAHSSHAFASPCMLVHNCGDWIDKQVSEQTGVAISQVISAKEKKLDFNKLDDSDDVVFALNAYYDVMIEYVFKHFGNKFQEVKSQFTQPLDIVIAGGTSMPKGFCKKLEKIVRGLQLPFQIKEVKHAKNPRNAVVEGLLTQAILTQKKEGQERLDKILT